jgi:hypothetical protein
VRSLPHLIVALSLGLARFTRRRVGRCRLLSPPIRFSPRGHLERDWGTAECGGKFAACIGPNHDPVVVEKVVDRNDGRQHADGVHEGVVRLAGG